MYITSMRAHGRRVKSDLHREYIHIHLHARIHISELCLESLVTCISDDTHMRHDNTDVLIHVVLYEDVSSYTSHFQYEDMSAFPKSAKNKGKSG